MKYITNAGASWLLKSPPSRAAWIEITINAESSQNTVSPPSRAAWIEIAGAFFEIERGKVAAFTGGVD